MKKIAIFGNTGGGKSTLARELSRLTGMPLCGLDLIQYQPGGGLRPHEEYLSAHRALLEQPGWIIDGFGCVQTLWERLAQADTLVHVDLPLPQHAWWVTKRCLKAPFVAPEGWPENSPILRSTLNSYRVLWLCHRRLTPKYRAYVAEQRPHKRVVQLRSSAGIAAFLREVERGQ